ncbi:MAG TPA: aminopeptidase N, partial [Acidothermaceae bacterium]|nr:aminopeptidase N [Acidothermaceae bacterium]
MTVDRNSLTRDEAAERARLILPLDGAVAPAIQTIVRLDFTPDSAGHPDRFASTTLVRFGCAEPGATTFVDLVSDNVRSLRLNGEELDPSAHQVGDRITLPGLRADNELEVVADCSYMHTGEGLHRFTDPVDGRIYLYTQFETADAHRVYACFDQPDIKTTFELAVVAPADWVVVGNTAPDQVPHAVEPTPSQSVSHWHFPASKPLSTYVTAIVAGPYHVVRDTHDAAAAQIPLGVYCRQSLAEYLDTEEIFTVTKQGFAFFEEIFERPYPFEKYDQLFVPEFNAGAMENAGAVTFLEDYIFRSRVTDTAYESRAGTILHEMAHMWFGDLVTMRWWDDLWLNESFATYMANLAQSEATRWGEAWTTFANEEKTWACRQDQLPTTHPIAADIVDVEAVETNFDGITYAKGASVLKQLVAWVGRDAFFSGLHKYFDAHAWGNSTLQDLLRALEDASGRDLSAWSKEWLESAGINTLRPEIETDDDGVITSFAVLQEAPPEHPTLRSHRLAVGCYHRRDDGIVREKRVELDVVGARTPVPELVGMRRPDLLVVNDDDLAYAKIRLDDRSLETVANSVGEVRDSLPRALCWAAAWDMTRDAEMAARDYLRMVIHLLDAERDIGVLQSAMRQARLAVERWADPAFRPTGLDMLAAATHAHLQAAEPGSDFQLAFLRAFAANAHSTHHVDTLGSLYAEQTSLPGLPLDTDLRWTLLVRLAAHGRVGAADVDAELARDDTSAGRRHAAAARAALPSSEAKEQAWHLVVERADTHNAEISAMIGGFQQANQLDLLRPYVERYFGAIGDVWQHRTGDTARTIAEGLFPYL